MEKRQIIKCILLFLVALAFFLGLSGVIGQKTITYRPKKAGDQALTREDIEYKYGVVPQIYMQKGSSGVQKVNPDSSFSALGFGGSSSALMSSSSAFSTEKACPTTCAQSMVLSFI